MVVAAFARLVDFKGLRPLVVEHLHADENSALVMGQTLVSVLYRSMCLCKCARMCVVCLCGRDRYQCSLLPPSPLSFHFC